MINIIGVAPDERALRAVPHAHVHMYGKRPRPGRKLGHCTITGAPPDARRAALARIEALLAHAEDAAEA
jgi:5-(carboxyamino)imidazole ribonucleotide synthase